MTKAEPREPVSRHTRWCLLALYALAVVWGIRNVHQDQRSALDILVTIAMAITLGWWAIADARQRGQSIPMLAKPWFFILFGLVVPGYVIWSRGGRGVILVIMHVVLWYALVTAAMHLTGVLLYGGEWLRGLGL